MQYEQVTLLVSFVFHLFTFLHQVQFKKFKIESSRVYYVENRGFKYHLLSNILKFPISAPSIFYFLSCQAGSKEQYAPQSLSFIPNTHTPGVWEFEYECLRNQTLWTFELVNPRPQFLVFNNYSTERGAFVSFQIQSSGSKFQQLQGPTRDISHAVFEVI